MSHEQLIKADGSPARPGVAASTSPTCMPAAGPVLVSACLVGLATRYDGQSKLDPLCLAALEGRQWVPVCPEQLGGLPTPREPASLGSRDGAAVLDGSHRVLTAAGKDVSDNFIRGAYAILEIGRLLHAEEVYLKADSPSCGWGRIKGVTATLLAREGFSIREF
jgi:uncharacterized protein YbbK (DUF523 family)